MTLGPLRGQIDYDPETFDDPDPEHIAVMTEGSIAAISESGFRSLPHPAEHAAGIDDVEGLGHHDPFDRVLLS